MLSVQNLEVRLGGRQLLRGNCLEVIEGECVAIVGPSGSGKTTWLNAIAGIRPIDAGQIALDGVTLSGLTTAQRARHRLENIGMVFQFAELMPELTVLENVALPLRLLGRRAVESQSVARDRLSDVGLEGQADSHPSTLSGGEAQRVGIARALVNSPTLLLADEPTGALDALTGAAVTNLLIQSARTAGAALVIITHDRSVAATCDRVLELHDGTLIPC